MISDDLVKAFDDEGKNDLRTRFYISKDTVGYKGIGFLFLIPRRGLS